MPAVGETAPDFALRSDDGRRMSLKDFRGRKVVLYFYPKDDTPGCTKEACSFRDNLARVTSKGAVVLGVSRDDAASHGKFRDKYHLNFPLLSDDEGKVTDAYGVWKNISGSNARPSSLMRMARSLGFGPRSTSKATRTKCSPPSDERKLHLRSGIRPRTRL